MDYILEMPESVFAQLQDWQKGEIRVASIGLPMGYRDENGVSWVYWYLRDGEETTWTLDTTGDWEYWECAGCGVLWTFSYGDPSDNDLNYCPKCGRKVEEFRGD